MDTQKIITNNNGQDDGLGKQPPSHDDIDRFHRALSRGNGTDQNTLCNEAEQSCGTGARVHHTHHAHHRHHGHGVHGGHVRGGGYRQYHHVHHGHGTQKAAELRPSSEKALEVSDHTWKACIADFAERLQRAHHKHKPHHDEDGTTTAWSMLGLIGFLPGVPMCLVGTSLVRADIVSPSLSEQTHLSVAPCLIGMGQDDSLHCVMIPDTQVQAVCSLVLTESPCPKEEFKEPGEGGVTLLSSPYQSWSDNTLTTMISKEDVSTVAASVLVRIEAASEMLGGGQHMQIQLEIQGLGPVQVSLMAQSSGLTIQMSVLSPAVASVLASAMPVLMANMVSSKAIKDKFHRCTVKMRVRRTE